MIKHLRYFLSPFILLHYMKYPYILVFLLSFSFMQVRLSFDSNSTYGKSDISSGISFSYDRVLLKQENIKVGVGIEHMLSRDMGIHTFESNAIYYFMRFIYEKKWSSYLRLGYNKLNGIQDGSKDEGLMLAFGADYKLNDIWHIEMGYHIVSTDTQYAPRIVSSIVRHFKKKDEK